MELIPVDLKIKKISLCFSVLGCEPVLYVEKILAVCPISPCENQNDNLN
jgi:hypothetical protein